MPQYKFHLKATTGEQTGSIYAESADAARAELSRRNQADDSTKNFKRSNRGRIIEHKINSIKLEEVIDEPKAKDTDTKV